MQESDKPLARELLLKSKVYRFFAMVFAVVGLVIFLVIYTTVYEGDVMRALKDPFVILFIVFPFVPSLVLSLRAKKAQTQLQKLLTGGQ